MPIRDADVVRPQLAHQRGEKRSREQRYFFFAYRVIYTYYGFIAKVIMFKKKTLRSVKPLEMADKTNTISRAEIRDHTSTKPISKTETVQNIIGIQKCSRRTNLSPLSQSCHESYWSKSVSKLSLEQKRRLRNLPAPRTIYANATKT